MVVVVAGVVGVDLSLSRWWCWGSQGDCGGHGGGGVIRVVVVLE